MERGWARGNAIPRMVFVGISLLLQIGWILLLILALNEYSIWIAFFTSILSFVVVLQLYSRHTASAMNFSWIMLILLLPIMGLSLYLMVEVCSDLGKSKKRLKAVKVELSSYLEETESVTAELEAKSDEVNNQCRYLLTQGGWPVYKGTDVRYFGQAAEAFEQMKRDLEQAEHFIFMEYFIVSDCSSFRELSEILIRKARQGVEVRLMYDDVGSVGYVNWSFAKQLNDKGIQCQVFNPALPVLNLFMNHRDHRKITVIDGNVGYTGGYNLSDEYFGRRFPYGKWKDTGLRLEGEAVRSLTAVFLELWSLNSRKKENYKPYFKTVHSIPEASGFVQPYADGPVGEERMAETVYLNLIDSAKKTCYIMTPYLIITDIMNNALGRAAKRGVDVRIITPGIPDKKTVYALTRSYYGDLASQGVRIYEYTPGFCHAKQCICDGKLATIGTSNLDYRSLYHHFENNVLLGDCQAVKKMAEDFENMFPQCREVTDKYRSSRGQILRIWQCALRLFAPLM